MATAQQKVKAASEALNRVKLVQPELPQQITAAWLGAGGKYTAPVKAAVNKVRNAKDRAAIAAALSDPAASKLLLSSFQTQVGGWVEGLGQTTADAGAIVGEMPTGVGNAVVDGLADSYQGSIVGFLGALTNANLWVRVGQVVVGVLLVTVAAAKLMPGIAPAPVTRVAKALR